MKDKKINIGIIGSEGYGARARKYLNNTGKFAIKACMDSDEQKAAYAAKIENARSYTSLDAMLECEDIDAVCINTPVLLHYEHSLKALEAGKHVFITKPVTNNSSLALDLKKLAGDRNLSYMVAHHARLHPYVSLVKKNLSKGRMGRICNGLFTCCSSGGMLQKKGNWRIEPGQNPGGPMLQCGIHAIDTLVYLFGPIKKVTAMARADITEFDVIDNVISIIEFLNGVQFTIVCNYTSAYMHTMDIFGSKANLHIHKMITGLGQTQMYFQKRATGPHEPWLALRIPERNDYPDPHGGLLEKEFARQIKDGIPDYTNLSEAIHALEVVEAIVESNKSGKEVEVPNFQQRN